MRKMLCGLVALLALNLVLDNVSHGQNKAAQKKNAVKQEDPTPEDYDKLRQMKEIYGVLTYVDLGTNKLNLKVEIKKQVPNDSPQALRAVNAQQQTLLRAQQQMMRDYQNIMSSRNPVQQQQRLQRFMLDYQNLQMKMVQAGLVQANLFKTVTTTKEFEFEVVAEPRVARVKLLEDYDDKGNPIEHTKEDLKKKQDPVLPGYTAKAEDLQPGQKVKLYLEPRKKTAKKKTDSNKTDPKPEVANQEKGDEKTTKNPTTGKTGGSSADEPPPPLVRSVLIYAEPDASTLPKTEKKKKKKNDN